MRQAFENSPTQLVLLGSGGGLLLYVLGISLCFLLRSELPIRGGHWQSAAFSGHFGVLLAFVMILLGIGLIGGTMLRVDSSVKNGRWTDEELEPLRRTLRRPVWKFVYAGVFVLLVAGFFLLPQNSQVRSLGFFAFFPLQTLASLASSLRKPDDSPGLRLGGGSNSVRSAHWGKR